jgi:ribosomal RNA-processing protein 12
LLLPNLGAEQAQELFAFLLEGVVLKNKDNGVQKRAYKIIGKLVESRKFAIDAEKLLGQLDDASEGLQSAAKKDRMHLLGAIVETIESDKLHLIPALIPETVLGLKEPSEKARAEAFQLVVKMGHRMKEGGTVKRAEMGDMDEDDVEDGEGPLIV